MKYSDLFGHKGLMFSGSSAVTHENARLQKVVSKKKVEQLKRAKARRLMEEQLKLENQIAEAEDAVELAKTKVQFYEIALGVLLAEEIVYKT